LNPKNNRLWQKPLDSFSVESEVWYCNVPIGAKKLSVFMSELSEKCNLSQIYTNHSIRATGATLLSKHKYGFGDAQIMSLTTYQRIYTEDKIKMVQTLTDILIPVSSSSNQAALPSTAMIALPSTSGMENIPPGAILQDRVPVNPPVVLADRSSDNTFMDEIGDIDFSDNLNEFNDNTAQVQNRQTNMQVNLQIFYGNVTVIHNLTINK
jgi:hypothetical protein